MKESGFVSKEHVGELKSWILVIDDDPSNLRMANSILSGQGMRVSCVKSGEAAVRFLRTNLPDLILLDIHMPEMDGFDTIAAIKDNTDAAGIPVVFLTADDDMDTETRALQAGAADFIKKPFIPEVLLLRIRHMVELTRLQADLAREVKVKTRELAVQNQRLERISRQIVMALAGAIDAKDPYTKGHSARVAEYSRTIAARAGVSEEVQNNIYMIGLLHDVGKIGIPSAIINKQGKLTDEEYAIIKTHPVVGENILRKIHEIPMLVTGAKYHHERYDGKGYPEGLSGEKIPVEARIIAVADAYDAMTSRRSYRGVIPQAQVRAEMEKGIGTQFDPVFAKIMLQMIDEDREYRMREIS